MENNEVMVTEMMPEEEFVETNSNGVIGFIVGLVLGGTGVAFGKLIKNKSVAFGKLIKNEIKNFRAKRAAKKAEAAAETKNNDVEVEE